MNRNEMRECRIALEKGQIWGFISNDEEMVKSYVSKAYGGLLDFDDYFELHRMKTPLGQLISVRKK